MGSVEGAGFGGVATLGAERLKKGKESFFLLAGGGEGGEREGLDGLGGLEGLGLEDGAVVLGSDMVMITNYKNSRVFPDIL
jgi:hypothetical protein